ncbi:MAG: hypothetical protein DMG59_01985, partial [Acidobacteria bacterium]
MKRTRPDDVEDCSDAGITGESVQQAEFLIVAALVGRLAGRAVSRSRYGARKSAASEPARARLEWEIVAVDLLLPWPHVHPGRYLLDASTGLIPEKHQVEVTQNPRAQLPVKDTGFQAGSYGQRTALAVYYQVSRARSEVQFDTA